jgi:tRNA(Ile)-lysidine synthase
MRDAEAADEPLGDAELDDLFAPFAGARLIALAVSGGADSLALMVAAARWRARRVGEPEMVVLTVDHRLRRGSRQEAAGVLAAAAAHGLHARMLVRQGRAPTANIEAEARNARYRLLVAAAQAAGASHLLTAHHRDDLAEALVLRLQRGAGVFGLAAMRRQVRAGGIVLARPFLDVARVRLAATTAAAGLAPVVDAMNSDPRFARARVRKLLPLLASGGLDPAALAATACRLADAADAVDDAASALIAAAVTVDDFAVARLEAAKFRAAPSAVRDRVVARLLMAVGGGDYPPRFERLAALTETMAVPAGGRFKRTLAGCVVEQRHAAFLVYRELGREGPEAAALKPGREIVWDGRFEIRAGRSVPAGLTVAALGEAGRRAVGGTSRGLAPRGAVAALPALSHRGRIVAVPALGYFVNSVNGLDVTVCPILMQRLAAPPLFPDFSTGS